MAVTSLEMVNILYAHVASSALSSDANKPNGKICKFRRPQNSKREDMVIGTLGNNREPVQKGVLLFNVYVPNLDPLQYPDLNNDRSQPDTARLLYVAKLVQASIPDEVWANDGTYAFEIVHESTYEDTNDQHYAGFRIEFFTIK
ncbi:hypothetical protein [Parapedobacter indicus]|uniref:Uncharacterized protein n=1 Tax=Parapedobacter indicus TaxID=1477437 RepID=A0A1I3V499_9SPHI|nr:hypothetical protein [Parapedobacter indicus]PPK98975.1 hypothetical protein CLV26_1154 [Parapedobacter indicus]SFJ89839.1 hypothetical protein SAMN05444682_115173 [Parapedobacter indicus]